MMAYSPVTDFMALLRMTGSGAVLTRMPGLDFVLAALARAGMFQLSTGQTAPTANQSTTAWLKPAQPSWTAEGVLFLWNAISGEYEVATPQLWTAFLSPGGYAFQSAALASNVINSGVTLLAIERTAPAATVLVLPSLAAQWLTGRKLQIVDFSTGVASHVVTLIATDGATIMQETSWQLLSTADQLAGITLQPSPDLNAWIIAP